MRLIIFYDLKMDDDENLKAYRNFRKKILSRGYIMIQFSIYMKTINASTKFSYEKKAMESIVPKNGQIRMLAITERQYQNMIMLTGYKTRNELINNSERYVKIDENF